MPFIIKSSLGLVSLAGIISSVTVPLTMKRTAKSSNETIVINSVNRGGHFKGSEFTTVVKDNGREEDLDFLVKVILYKLKNSDSEGNLSKAAFVEKRNENGEGIGTNLNHVDGLVEKVRTSETSGLDDTEHKNQMKLVLESVLKQGTSDNGRLGLNGEHFTTGGKNVRGVDVTFIGRSYAQHTLLKFDWPSGIPNKYIVAEYSVDQSDSKIGKLNLGIGECKEGYSSQCAIEKNNVDKRIQIIFKDS